MTQVQAELNRFKKDTAYFEAHQGELLQKYPEQWVAIHRERVVGADRDYESLLEELDQRGIPIGQALFKRLTRQEEMWILPA